MKVPRVFKLREAVLPALTSGQWCYKTPQFLHIDSGIYDCRLRNEHFLIVMHHSSLAKAAVNGLRICNCGETILPALAMAQQCLLRLCNMLQQATNSLFSNWQRRNKDQ